jgi:hypothetical protein
LDDRFKTCQDTPVDLINSEQTLGPIHLLAEGESAISETLLQSGQTRRVFLCLDKGQSERFRAQQVNDPQPVAASNCVATQADYESARPRVLWTPVGLRCEGW